jgi:di/tricarboxylate transporter
MTFEIGFLLVLLLGMVYLFFTEKIPVDLTAFLGLVVLMMMRYLTPDEAFSGFSSPAVITLLSIFIVSGALQHTGLADMMGGKIHALVGSREVPLMIVIMVVAGVLSAFMPNVAACAVLMPAVASIAKRTGLSPSRLFLPLATGAILGGTTTLVGTPPNILAGELLKARGLQPLGLFDFAPVGVLLLVAGILYMVTVGRRLLPHRQLAAENGVDRDLAKVYQLRERLFSIRIPEQSKLDGLTLAQARIGSTLNVQVVAILRDGRKHLAPRANDFLHSGDVLLVEGKLSDLQELVRVRGVEVEEAKVGDLPRPTRGVSGIRLRLTRASLLAGKTLRDVSFRQRYGVVVVGIRRGKETIRGHLGSTPLQADDELLALGTREQVEELRRRGEFEVREVGLSAVKELQEHVFLIKIPESSPLVGTTVGAGRIGELVGLTLGGIIREGETRLAPSEDEIIRAGDTFLVAGEPSGILALLEMGEVDLDADSVETKIESDEIGIVEATVAPRSSLIGRTFGDVRFRERYRMQVLALWREGRPIRTGLGRIRIEFGDALLVQGRWEHIRRLAEDPDFVVLSSTAAAPKRTKKAPIALGCLVMMIAMVVTGFQPIHVASFSAAVLAVVFGALTMREAYAAIEWRVIFLVAAILPIGIAMERTGAAVMLANHVIKLAGPLGPYAVVGSMVLLSSLLSQALDGALAVVLLTPVALQAASAQGISMHPAMIGVALATSMAFMTPFSSRAILLVMGAGGYRAKDYLRVGAPLTIILLLLLAFLVPLFFPF